MPKEPFPGSQVPSILRTRAMLGFVWNNGDTIPCNLYSSLNVSSEVHFIPSLAEPAMKLNVNFCLSSAVVDL